jgi:hypothetical protein
MATRQQLYRCARAPLHKINNNNKKNKQKGKETVALPNSVAIPYLRFS